MLYNRASGGVGLKWRRMHRRQTQELGRTHRRMSLGHTHQHTSVYSHLCLPSLTILTIFFFFAFNNTHVCTHTDTHTVGYPHR